MSAWKRGNAQNTFILTPISSVGARKDNNFPCFHRVLTEQIGVNHLQRHASHWEHGFIYLNTPTMQEVVSPRSEQRGWVLGASSRLQRAKLVRDVRIKDESPPVSAKPELNPSALRVSGPGTEDGMVGWVGGKARLKTWQPQLRAYRAGNPEIVADKNGNQQLPGDSYVS